MIPPWKKGSIDFYAYKTISAKIRLLIQEELTLVLPLATTFANLHFPQR